MDSKQSFTLSDAEDLYERLPLEKWGIPKEALDPVVKQFKPLYALRNDVLASVKELEENDSQRGRRQCIHSFFPLVEAHCHFLHQLSLWMAEAFGAEDGVQYDERDPLLDRFKSVHKSLTDVLDMSTPIDYNNVYWSNLHKLKKRRDEIVRAKTLEGITVIDEEVGYIRESIVWFSLTVRDFFYNVVMRIVAVARENASSDLEVMFIKSVAQWPKDYDEAPNPLD